VAKHLDVYFTLTDSVMMHVFEAFEFKGSGIFLKKVKHDCTSYSQVGITVHVFGFVKMKFTSSQVIID